jgi:hypothetical protein
MLKNTRIVRIVASMALVGGGILGVAVMGVAGTAGAQPGPSTTATPDILPNSTASTAAGATTVIKWKHLSQIPGYSRSAGIAITECNANVLMGDQSACNQNPSNLDMPGGPYLAGANRSGTGHKSISVVEGTVGDGTCSDGTVCYISVSSASQTSPVSYGLIAIAFNPAA